MANSTPNIVLGKITNNNNRPIANLAIAVYDVDMRSWNLLAETITDKDGKYSITWQQGQLKGREKQTVDIGIVVSTSKNKTELYKTPMQAVRFNVGEKEEINIAINQSIPTEIIEFDSLVKGVSLLADKVAIANLQENANHQDITFLSKELNVSVQKIEYLILAHRLQNSTKIDAAFFYGLFSQNTLLKNNSAKPFGIRLAIDINTDEKDILMNAAMADAKTITADIATAIKNFIIPNITAKNIKLAIEILSLYKTKAQEYYSNELPKKMLATVADFIVNDKLETVLTLLIDNKNDFQAFTTKIADPAFFKAGSNAETTKTILTLQRLLGLDNAIIKQILVNKKITKVTDIKKLAALNKQAWIKLLTEASATITGSVIEKKIIGQHASSLTRNLEQQFPTVAFSAQLARQKNPASKNATAINKFFATNPNFDLQKDNIDLQTKGQTQILDEHAKEELKRTQRIFKLVPHFGKTNALIDQNIHSSQSIVAAGQSRFVNEITPKAGIKKAAAKKIFQQAEQNHLAALMVFGEMQGNISAMPIAAISTTAISSSLASVNANFPNLKNLFKLIDVCECQQCRSVYSPAAYMVELLQWLSQRSVKDTIFNVEGNLAKAALFNRRPDLGEIDLSCANANTPVKYIDLVCEILEEAVAPDAGITYTGVPFTEVGATLTTRYKRVVTAALKSAVNLSTTDDAEIFGTETPTSFDAPYYLRSKKKVWKITVVTSGTYNIKVLRQTLSSAEELDAAPEYVNQTAYNTLKSSQFTFKLPFDIVHTEATAYFNRFGIERSELMQAFQTTTAPIEKSIAAEKLGLTDAERDIIVTPRATSAKQQLFWNAPAQWEDKDNLGKTITVNGGVLDYLKNVNYFLDKTILSFKELELLLKLEFIDKNGNLFIKHNDLTCDTEQKDIANLDLAALDRIHRFLRLQKKTGWRFDLLDEIICQPNLGNQILDDNCLIVAQHLIIISEKTNLKIEELIGFFGKIPFTIYDNESNVKPLYHQIFLNKAKNGFIDENLLPENVLLSNPFTPAIKNSIAVALQTKLEDIELILTGRNNVTFENLSYALAATRLMKKLKITAEEIGFLKELTNIDFTNFTQNLLDFITIIDEIKKASLKVKDVRYLLLHEAFDLPKRQMPVAAIANLLIALQAAYQANFNSNQSLYNVTQTVEEQLEVVKTELAKLDGIVAEDIVAFTRIIERDWTLGIDIKDIIDTNTALNLILGANVSLIKTKIDTLDNANVANFSTEKTDLVESFIVSIDNTIVLTSKTLDQKVNILSDLLISKNVLTIEEFTVLMKFIHFNRIPILYAKDALVKDKLEYIDKANNIKRPNFNALDIYTAINAYWIAPSLTKESNCEQLIKAFLDAIANYSLKQNKPKILFQTLATALKSTIELIELIVTKGVLKQPIAAGQPTLIDVLLPDVTTSTNHPKAIQLLHKLLQLIGYLKLNNIQISWFLENNKNLSWFELDGIPYDTGHTPIPISSFIAFTKVLQLEKENTPVDNPYDATTPISFFTIAESTLDLTTTADTFFEQLALLTGFEKIDLIAIDNYFFTSFNINNYKQIDNWYKILNAAESCRTLGANLSQITSYITPVLTSNDVVSLRITLKTRYDETTWLSTLKEIMDAIRPQKRNALVAYLLAVNSGFKNENDLFDYFLVDVEMEACMPSSRIVQAHNTIQLFTQRCLMGLEPETVANATIDTGWEQWKWMKNYRVWEANRKVFLYPENWIEPELRDDKSFLFTEMENELSQNELNEYNTEQAIVKYLEKLDDIAFLEVVATWYQSNIRTMHVFGRTKGGDPHIYYYRRFENEIYWTPWEKVELDITGDQLLAFERNNRLCLAWLIIAEEADPGQKVKIPAANPIGSEQPIDKPKKRYSIQLAISEYANKKWQPKKISTDALKTCMCNGNGEQSCICNEEKEQYCTSLGEKSELNLLYFEYLSEIWVFNTKNFTEGDITGEYMQVRGKFNLAGCKGFPELLINNYAGFKDYANAAFFALIGIDLGTTYGIFNSIETLDFYPDFKESHLKSNRYFEKRISRKTDTGILVDDNLAVRDGFNVFLNLLQHKNFQLLTNKTPADFRITYPHQFTKIDFISLMLQLLIGNILRRNETKNGLQFKLPLGTFLPYFEENSRQGYVLLPGLYATDKEKNKLNDSTKKTGSDILNLIEMVENLIHEAIAYSKNPTPELDKQIMDDFHSLENEIKSYIGLMPGVQFKNMYHPLVCKLRGILYNKGIPALMKRESQFEKTDFNFLTAYLPSPAVALPYPVEDVDFSSDGSYSSYNWELFFHAPLLIASRLTKDQRFEEAMQFLHYIFNPTGALGGTAPQKYWVTKPFYLYQDADYKAQWIETILNHGIGSNFSESIQDAIKEWRKNPFKPHAIARFRPVAYQKATLMKYIDNLIEWGDNLFRQDTMESIAQATQMYIMADKLLGDKPRLVPTVVKQPYETYNQLAAKIDSFGNAIIELENILPDVAVLPESGNELPPPATTLGMAYFCIPQNEKMLEYWDRVADRLFKIRHCQNIDGVERSLALFAPPIDPGMLVRAAAAGLDISSVIAGLNAPLPYYRFNVLAQKATELTQEVRGLGSSLLQTLEKKDAEAMSLLRSELELKVLKAVKDMKLLSIEESKEQIEVLKRTQKVTEERQKYYKEIDFMNPLEITALTMNGVSTIAYTISSIMEMTAGATKLIPDVTLGASGFGGSPVATALTFGGEKVSGSVSSFAKGILLASQVIDKIAGGISTVASYQRRKDDWGLQERTADLELKSIEKQIVAAEIRKEIAETDLKNHELQIENANKTDEFMRSKFTNKELYEWMMGQISSVYFKSYQLAYDFAKKAERCYCFELGNDDTFISYVWDSMKKGLQSADLLIHDIKRMETSYLDKNKRENELTKHISIAQLDPLALIRLKETGVCDFEIPEVLYDMDHPGHYFRRLKSVSISIPCIAGPYTSVSAKLSLVNNRYRKNTNNLANYSEDIGNDERFAYNIGAIQSIATSSAQNDSGVFELNFRDERYLPFEGTGAISSWRLELPSVLKQFDYHTISDVIIHVKYTSRDGGSELKTKANEKLKEQLDSIKQSLSETGIHIAINLKHDMPNEWYSLTKNGKANLTITTDRLPYFIQNLNPTITSVFFISKSINGLTIDSNAATSLINNNELGMNVGICTGIQINTPFDIHAHVSNTDDLIMVIKFSI